MYCFLVFITSTAIRLGFVKVFGSGAYFADGFWSLLWFVRLLFGFVLMFVDFDFIVYVVSYLRSDV